MHATVFFLLGFGLVLTALKFSLFERSRACLLAVTLACASPLLVLPWAVRQQWTSLQQWILSEGFLRGFSVLLVIEALVVLLLGLQIMRLHYEDQRLTMAKLIGLSPSLFLIAGLVFTLVYGLNAVHGAPFLAVGVGCSLSAFVCLLAVSFLLRRAIRPWVVRLELLVVLCFGQLLLAMSLPLLIGGAPLPGETVRPDWVATVVLGAVAVTGALAGYGLRRAKRYRT